MNLKRWQFNDNKIVVYAKKPYTSDIMSMTCGKVTYTDDK